MNVVGAPPTLHSPKEPPTLNRVTFWGTRGSIPVPGESTRQFGGNTACVEIEANGKSLILDAGTGIRTLGNALAHREEPEVDLVLSHTHWDHIQGLPFFAPLYQSGRTLRIWGPRQDQAPLATILGNQMDPSVFPVPISEVSASVHVMEIDTERFTTGGFGIEAYPLRHPGRTLGFRVSCPPEGKTVAYVTDNELVGAHYGTPPEWRDGLVHFLQGVDVLIHDAMYLPDHVGQRVGWGHSSPRQAVDLAAEAGCHRLVLFHHDPDHDDTTVARLADESRQYAGRLGVSLTIDAAAEGWSVPLNSGV